ARAFQRARDRVLAPRRRPAARPRWLSPSEGEHPAAQPRQTRGDQQLGNSWKPEDPAIGGTGHVPRVVIAKRVSEAPAHLVRLPRALCWESHRVLTAEPVNVPPRRRDSGTAGLPIDMAPDHLKPRRQGKTWSPTQESRIPHSISRQAAAGR